MERNSIGLVELSSIASGFQACDAMLKASYVELVLARSICSGKYIVLVKGDVAAVEASVESGCRAGYAAIVDSMIIPNLHESVFPALTGINKAETLDALGIIESFSVASLIEAADAAVKTAEVELIEIRLAMALGGKAFVSLTGSVAAVQSAVDAGAAIVAAKGLLTNKVVIARPRPELLDEII